MKKLYFILTILNLIVLGGCEIVQKDVKSDFKIVKDYANYSAKMKNGDTMNIHMKYSECLVSERSQLQITKSRDSLYFQITKHTDSFNSHPNYHRVSFQDTSISGRFILFLSQLSLDLSDKFQEPFFTITNPKEVDTVFLFNPKSGINSPTIIEYKNILHDLYPQQIEKSGHEVFLSD